MFRPLRLVLLVGAVSLLAGHRATAQNPELLPCCAADPDAVIAVIDGERVRVRDLDGYSRTNDPRALFLMNRQLSDPRVDLLRSVDEERLLEAEAARAGRAVSQLLKERLRVTPVTDAAVRRLFERIRDQQPGATYGEMRPVIRMFLEGQLRAEARGRYLRDLQRAAR